MKRTAIQRKVPLRVTRTELTVKIRRKCCICKTNPVANPMASVCSTPCAIEKAAQDRAKRERKEAAVRREQLKTRSDYMKDAQIAFNAFIRARDAAKDCICCVGRPLPSEAVGGGFDCGHYRSVGSAPHLRFDERNAHGQTKQCNRYGAGRAVDYRIGLIKRIGIEAVEALEADQEARKFTIEELKEIKATYKKKLKELRGSK